MTTIDVAALLVTPVGGLLLGAAVYWVTARQDRGARHPAE